MVNRPNDGRVLIWPETDSCSKRATAEMNGMQTARIWIRKTKVEGTKRRSAMQAQINRAKSTTTVGLREGSKKISSAKFCGYTSGGKKSRVQRANNNLRKDFRLAQYTTLHTTDGYQLDLLPVANPFRGLHQDVPQWQTWPFSGGCSYKQFTSLSPCVIGHSGLFRLPVYRIR